MLSVPRGIVGSDPPDAEFDTCPKLEIPSLVLPHHLAHTVLKKGKKKHARTPRPLHGSEQILLVLQCSAVRRPPPARKIRRAPTAAGMEAVPPARSSSSGSFAAPSRPLKLIPKPHKRVARPHLSFESHGRRRRRRMSRRRLQHRHSMLVAIPAGACSTPARRL